MRSVRLGDCGGGSRWQDWMTEVSIWTDGSAVEVPPAPLPRRRSSLRSHRSREPRYHKKKTMLLRCGRGDACITIIDATRLKHFWWCHERRCKMSCFHWPAGTFPVFMTIFKDTKQIFIWHGFKPLIFFFYITWIWFNNLFYTEHCYQII